MGWHVVGDWGTTRLRLYRIEDGAIAERLDGPGIGALSRAPADHLLSLLNEWDGKGRPERVLLCGMAGARNGLREAPYAPCPVDDAGWRAEILRFELDGLPVQIAPGIRDDAMDVMRGEETQIFGLLAREPALRSGRRIIVLPGTHSKWACVEDGVIRAFRTFFTGEMFALLADRSTLLQAKAVAGATEDEAEGWADGIARALASGAGLLGSVFEARAGQLLRGRSIAWGRGFLSGLLIGSEIEEARRLDWLADSLTFVGATALAGRYRDALSGQGVETIMEDGDACVLAGLELLND